MNLSLVFVFQGQNATVAVMSYSGYDIEVKAVQCMFGAVFNSVSKVICVCFGFVLLRCDWFKKLALLS